MQTSLAGAFEHARDSAADSDACRGAVSMWPRKPWNLDRQVMYWPAQLAPAKLAADGQGERAEAVLVSVCCEERRDPDVVPASQRSARHKRDGTRRLTRTRASTRREPLSAAAQMSCSGDLTSAASTRMPCLR